MRSLQVVGRGVAPDEEQCARGCDSDGGRAARKSMCVPARHELLCPVSRLQTDRTYMLAEDSLESWGWDAQWAAVHSALESRHRVPGRVTGQDRDRWSVQTAAGAAQARIVRSSGGAVNPVAGDWVLVEPGPSVSDPLSIVGVLPRRSAMSRGAAGASSTEQVLAANVDVVWIVHGLDLPPNLRRLERYLTAAWESGGTPKVVLTKADLAPNPSDRVAEVETVCIGVSVHVVSSGDPARIAALKATLRPVGHMRCSGLPGRGSPL
jgi:ribosome biogenesis GTPase / thiamine phosphate phosphatase